MLYSHALLLAQTVTEPASLTGGLIRGAVAALLFSTIGLVMFALAFWLINKSVPFSLRKEIEDDQNTALGIVIGSVIIGIALIISAAIHS